MAPERSPVSVLTWLGQRTYLVWLFFIVTLSYTPFIGTRVIRTAGDEKVYVSQAIEMAEKGHWFLQTLQGSPDYYKGPLHYLLLRLGMMIFGWNPWATLYMNYLLVFAGACAVGAIVRKHCEGPHSNGLAVWAGAFFATCTGVYAHFFASQMEAELAGLFAVAFYFLDQTPLESAGLPFWLTAGLIGWSKSPLHAGFAGVSAVLFWLTTGELGTRLRNWRSWAAALVGVLFCVAGYLPAYLYDRQNFLDIYIVRETLSKGDSGQSWTVSFESVLGFYLFPWMLLALVAYAEFTSKIVRPWKYFFTPSSRRALWLAFSGVLPSFLFFAWHPYHFENYDLPVISGVILFVAVVFSQRLAFFERLYRGAAAITALILLVLPITLSALSSRFGPMPAWWPSSLVPLAWAGSLISAGGLLYLGVFKKFARLEWLSASMVGFFLALGATISMIGERDLYDLRQFLKSPQGQNVHLLGYYNLHHNIWSEWGFLNFWLGKEGVKVVGLHEPADLKAALSSGEVVLVPPKGPLEDFKAFVKKELPALPLEITPWKRWRTQGKSESGEPLWKDAWDKRDLSILETDFLIVKKSGSTP